LIIRPTLGAICIVTLRKEVTIQDSDQPYGYNDKRFRDKSSIECNNYTHFSNRTISHFDKSRWLIGGDLLTDPDIRDDQRDEDLVNKSNSALPPISVTGRLVGKYRLHYPE
jgi:hypothetical protein